MLVQLTPSCVLPGEGRGAEDQAVCSCTRGLPWQQTSTKGPFPSVPTDLERWLRSSSMKAKEKEEKGSKTSMEITISWARVVCSWEWEKCQESSSAQQCLFWRDLFDPAFPKQKRKKKKERGLVSLLYCLWLLMELLGSQENHPLFVTISRSTCLFFFPRLCCPLLSLLPYHLPFLPGADRVPRHEQLTDNRDRPGASCPAGWAHCLPPLSPQSFSLSEVPFLVLSLFFNVFVFHAGSR